MAFLLNYSSSNATDFRTFKQLFLVDLKDGFHYIANLNSLLEAKV